MWAWQTYMSIMRCPYRKVNTHKVLSCIWFVLKGNMLFFYKLLKWQFWRCHLVTVKNVSISSLKGVVPVLALTWRHSKNIYWQSPCLKTHPNNLMEQWEILIHSCPYVLKNSRNNYEYNQHEYRMKLWHSYKTFCALSWWFTRWIWTKVC